MDCIFCKIARHDVPKDFVYEDETVMVFDDIHPIKPIHLLIVPKQHVPELLELSDDALWNHMREVTKKMVVAKKLDTQGYRVAMHGGGAQAIDHLHMHLVGPLGKNAKM